ncbi:MAG: hypothetical protein ACREE5_03040, partial [Acetobacteraceae bacterium]
MRFQAGDPPAHRRLRAIKLARRGREAAFIDRGDEGPKLIQRDGIQHGHPSYPQMRQISKYQDFRLPAEAHHTYRCSQTETNMNLSQRDVVDEPSMNRRQAAAIPSLVALRSGAMKSALPAASLDQLFRLARTYNEWSSRDVDVQTIRELYELLKWAPTAANSSPARFVWGRSAEGKAILSALAMGANQPKILAAPVTVIIG